MSSVLLVIDIQNDYFPGGVLPLAQAEEVEQRVVAAIVQARAAGDKVVLVRHISTEKEGLFADGSAGSEIRPAILDAAGDAPVVIKHMADSFQETDLATYLQTGDKLLVCGMMTQNCVAFTAMSRDADEYSVQVLGDLCAAPLDVVHGIALHALGSKLPVTASADLWR